LAEDLKYLEIPLVSLHNSQAFQFTDTLSVGGGRRKGGEKEEKRGRKGEEGGERGVGGERERVGVGRRKGSRGLVKKGGRGKGKLGEIRKR